MTARGRLAVGLGVAGFVLLAWAASSQAPPLLHGPDLNQMTAWWTETEPGTQTPTEKGLTPHPMSGRNPQDRVELPLTALFYTMVAVAAVVAAALGVWLWRHRWVGWRRARVPASHSTTPLPEVAQQLRDDVDAGLADLAGGQPRNAVVATWLALESSLERAGMPRTPAETATEYVDRALQTLDLDRAMTTGLASLYREARFSDHSMTEQQRSGAVAALRSLRDDLDRRAETGAPEERA